MDEDQGLRELRRILEAEGEPMTKVRRCLAVARKADAAAKQLAGVAVRLSEGDDAALSHPYAKSVANMVELASVARDQARRLLRAKRSRFGFGYKPRTASYPDWGTTGASRPWRPN